ncbi:hypothetical protein SAMN05443582_11616 [Phyllobacterium sp. OV277]|nr:hypothetical protein SAMN05443582_11616 [Phyllobacterium sp. OV277]
MRFLLGKGSPPPIENASAWGHTPGPYCDSGERRSISKIYLSYIIIGKVDDVTKMIHAGNAH